MKTMRDYINLVETAMQESKNKEAYEYHRDMAKLDTRPGRKDIHNALANKYGKRMADEKKAQKPQGVAEGSETAADIDKKIEFHKQGQAAAQYKGSMNKMHAKKIKDLEAKKQALKQGVAEEQLEETSPDAIAEISRLTRRP